MRRAIFAWAAAAALTTAALPAVVLAGGNGIECTDMAGSTHQSPGLCVQAGRLFKGVGQAAQYFTEDPSMLDLDEDEEAMLFENGRITGGELIHRNCTRPKDRR